MTGWIMAAFVAAGAMATPLSAQVNCRPNPLGGEVCVGVPAPEPRSRRPFRTERFGLGSVQPPPSAESGPRLTPAGRTDALGNTFLTAKDLPPNRPLPGVNGVRNCARDALSNLVCN